MRDIKLSEPRSAGVSGLLTVIEIRRFNRLRKEARMSVDPDLELFRKARTEPGNSLVYRRLAGVLLLLAGLLIIATALLY